ncbi:MAG: MBL fold metallo-hydrolase, partial [Actinobacteria bacterium]|nr:MBL fold metallo-hydrolase [Actinomycetota bacterium]
MLVERSMDAGWLSNAYAIADREGGTAVFVDSGADVEPLVAAVERWGATPAALLRTHAHGDHVAHEDELVSRFGIPVVAEPGEWEWGGLRVRGIATPGHSDDMVAFVVNDEAVLTGDTLFLDAVGGGSLEAIRRAVMDVFMALPDGTRVLPGHT